MKRSSIKILVWDVPTRVFHWSMVLCFIGAWLSAESERWRLFHVSFGYTMVGLVAFRLIWGLAGTRYARFSEFIAGPKKVVSYVTSVLHAKPIHYVGHNPIGALAIALMLILVVGIGLTGYVTYNELDWFKSDHIHEFLSESLMLIVTIHIGGVVISSSLHKENLIKAMITGKKDGQEVQGISQKRIALGVFLLICIASFWFYQFK